MAADTREQDGTTEETAAMKAPVRIGGKIVGRIGGTHATQSRRAGRRAVR